MQTETLTEMHAVTQAHHLERQLLLGRIARLEALLAEHAIPLPAEDARLGLDSLTYLNACKAVVRAAYDLLPHIEHLRELVGSGAELLQRERWR